MKSAAVIRQTEGVKTKKLAAEEQEKRGKARGKSVDKEEERKAPRGEKRATRTGQEELTSSPPVKLDVDAMQRKSKDKESKTPRFEPGLKPVDVKPTDAKRPG